MVTDLIFLRKLFCHKGRKTRRISWRKWDSLREFVGTRIRRIERMVTDLISFGNFFDPVRRAPGQAQRHEDSKDFLAEMGFPVGICWNTDLTD